MSENEDIASDLFKKLITLSETAGRKRPDIDYIRVVHDEAVWNLVETLESQEKYAVSLEIMTNAASLRKLQAEAGDSLDALFDQAIFLGRIAWITGQINHDHKQAIETAHKAISIYDELSEHSEFSKEVKREKGVVYLLVADIYYEIYELQKAQDAYKKSLVNFDYFLKNQQTSEESRKEIKKMKDYITEKLNYLVSIR